MTKPVKVKKKTRDPSTQMVVRAFHILDILKKYTDEKHSMDQKDILKKVKEDGLVNATDKTIRQDLRVLMEVLNAEQQNGAAGGEKRRITYRGMDQESSKMKAFQYHHLFSNEEIKYLLYLIHKEDIEERKKNSLKKRLKSLGSRNYRYPELESVGGGTFFSY